MSTAITTHELMTAFDSEPLAPIICPPAVYSRRPCLTPRADGTTVDSLEDIDFDPVLSLQVVRYTPQQLEEQEESPSHTPVALFNPLPQGVNSFREYCYQCHGNIFECHCDNGEDDEDDEEEVHLCPDCRGNIELCDCFFQEEEKEGELHCDVCQWQLYYKPHSSFSPFKYDKCFCDVLIASGRCSKCPYPYECNCDRCAHCAKAECACIDVSSS
jgi:hypothetical protein